MSEQVERTEMIREQRNALLSMLCACYPGAFEGIKLFRVMLGIFPQYTRTFAFKDLFYLEEKGYVVRKNRFGRIDTSQQWTTARWALTARGNEVANRLTEDPALEV